MTNNPKAAFCCSILSRVMLDPDETSTTLAISKQVAAFDGPSWSASDWKELETLAGMHHVIIRALPRLQAMLLRNRNQSGADLLAAVLEKEQARIARAIPQLQPICQALEQAGNVIVIKSLDHWPDLGSDLDLYTDADSSAVLSIMCDRLHAKAENRSWGDRMANKWNFAVPGLPELVEIHVGRLGQMGEQRIIGQSLIARAVTVKRGDYEFRVPAPEDRIVISTLQRMFRHFYIRLCDIAEIARLIDQNVLDYDYLRSLGQQTGLWDGLATYLRIIVEYAGEFGCNLQLPAFVASAARFGNEQVQFKKKFLRIPILPQSARIYAAELAQLICSGDLASSFRLSLMPALATAAAVKQKVAGNDSGIW